MTATLRSIFRRMLLTSAVIATRVLGVQIQKTATRWPVATNTLNTQELTANKGLFSSLGLGGSDNSSRKKSLTKCYTGLRTRAESLKGPTKEEWR